MSTDLKDMKNKIVVQSQATPFTVTKQSFFASNYVTRHQYGMFCSSACTQPDDTQRTKKKGRFNYPHYCTAVAPHLAISPAPRNIVSRPINPPAGHLRYATRLLHHNTSLCTRSLVSTTTFRRNVTPCLCVRDLWSRRLQSAGM